MSLRNRVFSSVKDRCRRLRAWGSPKAGLASNSPRSPAATAPPVSPSQIPPCGVAAPESPQFVPLAQRPVHSPITLDHPPPQVTVQLKAEPSTGVITEPKASHAPMIPKPTSSTGFSKSKAPLKALESCSNAISPLKLIARNLSACLEIFEGAYDVRNEYKELFGGMDWILGQLNEYGGRAANTQMTAGTRKLCESVGNELKDIQDRYGKTTIFTSEDSERMVKSYKRIQMGLERLMMDINLSTLNTMNDLNTETQLKSLSPSMAAVYNSAHLGDEGERGCTPGTRRKELATLLDWIGLASPTEKLYWINGMAGTGKTTIAYTLCEELEKSAELGASFFCSNLECRDVKFIFPSIAYQLARSSAPFCRALLEILRAEHDLVARNPKDQFEYLLARPLAQARDNLATDLVVVIDALDECVHENSIKQFLDVLISQTTELDLPIRFLVSSRPEWVISERMMRQDRGSRLVLHEVDAQTVTQDIETFLQGKLAGIDLIPSQLADLVQLSGVHFFSASAIAHYINEGFKFGEEGDRLNAVLGLLSEPTEKDREVDDMYESILQRAFQKSGGKRNQARLKELLDTIVCAQEPMTIDALAGLLGLKDGAQVEACLRPLASVIHISHTNNLVTTLHTSFHDYILSQKRSPSFYCDPTKTHALISRKCLEAIISSEAQPNICAPDPSCASDIEVRDLLERADKPVSPQALYACRNWVTHLTRGEVLNQPKDLLWNFLSTRLLLWLDILNDNKCIHMGPQFMEQVESWCTDNGCSEEHVALAHDAWRFVTMFATQAAPHGMPNTCLSILRSWPKNAPITKHYFMEAASEDEPVRGREADSSEPMAEPPEGNSSQKSSIFFPPDNTQQVDSVGDGTVRDWSLQNGGEIIRAIPVDNELISSPRALVDSIPATSNSRKRMVHMWDAKAEAMVLGPLENSAGLVDLVRYLQGDIHIDPGSYNKAEHPWNNGASIIGTDSGVFRGDKDAVSCVTLFRGGNFISPEGRYQTLRVLDARDSQNPCPVLILKEYMSHFYLVVFYSDRMRLVAWLLDLNLALGPLIVPDSKNKAIRLDRSTQRLLCPRPAPVKRSSRLTDPQLQPFLSPHLISESQPPPSTVKLRPPPALLRAAIEKPLFPLAHLRLGLGQQFVVTEQTPNENYVRLGDGQTQRAFKVTDHSTKKAYKISTHDPHLPTTLPFVYLLMHTIGHLFNLCFFVHKSFAHKPAFQRRGRKI